MGVSLYHVARNVSLTLAHFSYMQCPNSKENYFDTLRSCTFFGNLLFDIFMYLEHSFSVFALCYLRQRLPVERV